VGRDGVGRWGSRRACIRPGVILRGRDRESRPFARRRADRPGNDQTLRWVTVLADASLIPAVLSNALVRSNGAKYPMSIDKCVA